MYKNFHGQRRADITSYLYFGCEYTTDEMENGGKTWMSRINAPRDWYHSAYTLVCWGPDYWQNAAEFIEPKRHMHENERYLGTIYDPTNGLRSDGDVISARGDVWFQGYVCYQRPWMTI